MSRYLVLALCLAALVAAAQQPARRGQPFQPKPADIQQIQTKTEEIEAMVKGLKPSIPILFCSAMSKSTPKPAACCSNFPT